MKNLFYIIGAFSSLLSILLCKDWKTRTAVVLAFLSFIGLWEIDYLNQKKITSASATIALELEFSENNLGSNWNLDSNNSSGNNGSYLNFIKNDKKILILMGEGPFLMNGSNDKATAFGQFDLLAHGSQLVGDLNDLNNSVVVFKVPEISYFNSATSIKGEINLYINGNHKIKINLPSQKINNEMIKANFNF